MLVVCFTVMLSFNHVYAESTGSKGNAPLGIFKVEKEPVIDGVAEQIWRDYSKNIVIFHYDAVQGVSDSYECVSYLLWDEENLYLLAEIIDMTPMQNQNTGSEIWNGDGVELFIGTDMTAVGSLLHSDRQLILSGGLVNGKPQYYWYNNAPLKLI